MSGDQPHSHHSDDTVEADGPPTDAVTDEVRADAVRTAGSADGAPASSDSTAEREES